VVQLSFSYGLFYKNVTTRGPLLIIMVYKTTDSQDFKLKRENQLMKLASHLNYYAIATNNLLQISIHAMPVIEASLTLSFLQQQQHVSSSKSETMVGCFVCHSICFRFDLLHRRKFTLAHVFASKRRVHI